MAGRLSHGLIAILMLLASVMAKPSSERTSVPALFIFGDSLFDIGNNDFLPNSTAKANFPHNGVDFPGGTPTGRFSNAYNTADYIAKLYGFKRSPPAFLSLTKPQLRGRIYNGGINFASSGSGIFNTTGVSSFVEIIPMDTQIDYFRRSLESFRGRTPSTATQALLSKSIFIISAGSNDLFLFYESSASLNVTATEYIATMASEHKRQLKTLYNLGARRLAMLGVGMIGCVPSLRRLSASSECLTEINDYAFMFDEALQQALEELTSECEGMKYSMGNGRNFGNMILEDPLAYGFKEYKSACCGAGRLNAEAACTPTATLCPHREQFYFWDMNHPTDSAARLQAEVLFGGPPTLVGPINFGQLSEDKALEIM